MADALYVKTASGPVKVEIGGGAGAPVRNVFTSVSRPSALTAGTAFNVPTHTVGGDDLSVYVNGLLVLRGTEYTDVSTTSIAFTFDIPTDYLLCAVTTTGGAEEARKVQVDSGRGSVLLAGAAYQVPAHAVGENRVMVYINGLLVDGWRETSQTTIVFDFNISATSEIVVEIN